MSDFIANDEWPPIQPTSVHWINRFAEQCWNSCHKLQPKPKSVPEFIMHLVCLTFRNPLTTL